MHKFTLNQVRKIAEFYESALLSQTAAQDVMPAFTDADLATVPEFT